MGLLDAENTRFSGVAASPYRPGETETVTLAESLAPTDAPATDTIELGGKLRSANSVLKLSGCRIDLVVDAELRTQNELPFGGGAVLCWGRKIRSAPDSRSGSSTRRSEHPAAVITVAVTTMILNIPAR